MTPDRDTHYCKLCGRLGSGVHHKPSLFIGDCCSSRMKEETVLEIVEMWK